MEYFSILNLDREPFSNSPDPRFFYQSRQHLDCLHKIELSIRLKRGLCIILGDVGTGKSTLCRELIRRLGEDDAISSHLLLDPLYPDDLKFLAAISEAITGIAAGAADEWTLKERIKQRLFTEGVEQNRTVTLIIDEGQKIRPSCLEYLREFLNYETNDHKLVQIIIFAQTEFADTVRNFPNFTDRVNLSYRLGPLGVADTARMIRSRLRISSDQHDASSLFTPMALWAVHRATHGYPRRIIHLCHKCLLATIIQNKSRVDARTVAACIRHQQEGIHSPVRRRWAAGLGAAVLAGILAVPAYQWATRIIFEPPSAESASATPFMAESPAPVEFENLAQQEQQPALPETSETAVISDQPPGADDDSHIPTLPQPGIAKAEQEQSLPGVVVQEEQIEPAGVDDATGLLNDPILGKVTMQFGENLSGMTQWVYGEFTFPILERVMLANPELKDPNQVVTGQSIRFPADPAMVVRPPGNRYWVQIAERDSLHSAIQILREYPPAAPRVRMVPYKTVQGWYAFRIVLRQPLAERDEAYRLLADIPQKDEYQPLVFSQWPPVAAFYADPYRTFSDQPSFASEVWP